MNAKRERSPSPSPYQEAIRLLSARPHSVEELKSRLLGRGWTTIEIEPVLLRLQEQGYLDDAKFATFWVEQRHRIRSYGPERLRRELLLRGVEQQTIDQALREVFGEADLLEHAIKIGRKALDKWVGLELETKQRRLFSYLVRLGYTPELSGQAVETCLTEFLNDR